MMMLNQLCANNVSFTVESRKEVTYIHVLPMEFKVSHNQTNCLEYFLKLSHMKGLYILIFSYVDI